MAGLLGIAGLVAWWRLLYSAPPVRPELSAPVTKGSLSTNVRARTFQEFVPTACSPGAPLLLVLHGSRGDADQMRRYTGYEFERLADAHGFIVVYPEGYLRYWNDARRKGNWPAKTLGVDDVGFLRDLVQHVHEEHGRGPVFAAGYSNGGHMCFRLALEAPDLVDGVAVFGANMPTDDNCVSPPATRPVPAMFVNGTRDPINPYDGGRVAIFGFGDRGTVRSSVASAEYFARLLGTDAKGEQPEAVVPAASDRATWVEHRAWTGLRGGEVALYTVHGGGHTIPQSRYRFPRLIGPTETRFDAPAACWAFFARVIAQDVRPTGDVP